MADELKRPKRVWVEWSGMAVLAVPFLFIAFRDPIAERLAPLFEPGAQVYEAWMWLPPYSGFYTAWVGFLSTLITGSVALFSAGIVIWVAKGTDRREARKQQEADIAFAFALRQECRQVIDQIPGMNGSIAQRIADLEAIPPPGPTDIEEGVDPTTVVTALPVAIVRHMAIQISAVQPTMPDTLSEHENIGRLGGEITERAYWFRSKLLDALKAIGQFEKVISSEGIPGMRVVDVIGVLKGISTELDEARRRGIILKDEKLKPWLEARDMRMPVEE